MYFGFENEEDVLEQFHITLATLNEAKILAAFYSYADYEGWATVLIIRNGIFYEVNGNHCSCCGLEGQWGEEETTLEAMIIREFSGKEGEHFLQYITDLFASYSIEKEMLN